MCKLGNNRVLYTLNTWIFFFRFSVFIENGNLEFSVFLQIVSAIIGESYHTFYQALSDCANLERYVT